MYFRVECKIITKNTFKYSSVHNQLMFWSQFVSPHLVVTYTSKLDQYVNVRLKLGGLLLYLKIKCHTCEEKWPTYISLLDLNSVCNMFFYFSLFFNSPSTTPLFMYSQVHLYSRHVFSQIPSTPTLVLISRFDSFVRLFSGTVTFAP